MEIMSETTLEKNTSMINVSLTSKLYSKLRLLNKVLIYFCCVSLEQMTLMHMLFHILPNYHRVQELNLLKSLLTRKLSLFYIITSAILFRSSY